jgi:hypothetical protein
MLTLSVAALIVIVAVAVIAAFATRHRAMKWLAIVAGIFILLALILTCGSLWFGAVVLNREPEPLPFSVEGWNSARYDANGNFSYTRYRMVDDLLRRYDFHGWSMAEVEKLLNVPDKEEGKESRHLMYYDLGNGLDYLIVEIDAERRVIAYRVYKH